MYRFGRHLGVLPLYQLLATTHGRVAESVDASASGGQSQNESVALTPYKNSFSTHGGRVAELVDAQDSKSCDRKVMRVRFSPRPPRILKLFFAIFAVKLINASARADDHGDKMQGMPKTLDSSLSF